MGQKVHPGGLRVGVIHDWKSNWWVPNKEFAAALLEDLKIREHILKKLSHAGLGDINIRKDKQRITIDIFTARPGIVIGKSGVEVDALRKEVHGMTQKNVHININEIKRPELDAKLVAQSIAEQLQNRVSFRRAMKRSLASAIRSGAAGVKVQCSGRLGGSEMSRSEQYSEGRVPLHTIRADIDYGFTEARTPTGRIGVKVWINKGEIMPAGYGGVPGGGKETRLGDQDTARRRGGITEGLGASREGGRGRQQDREGLGPVRRGRPGQRGGRPGPRPPRDGELPVTENVEAAEPAAETTVLTRVEETAPPTPLEETAVPTPVDETAPPTPLEETAVPTPVEETAPPTPLEETAVPTPVEETASPTPVEETAVPTPVEETASPTPVEETAAPEPEATSAPAADEPPAADAPKPKRSRKSS
jgi:small subunit ribosomal protein S3